jgi:hypothetical protein
MIQPLPEQDVDEYAAIIPALEQLIPSPGSADPLPGRVGSEYIDPCNRDFHSLGSLLAMQVSRFSPGPFNFAFMLPPSPPRPRKECADMCKCADDLIFQDVITKTIPYEHRLNFFLSDLFQNQVPNRIIIKLD